MFKITSIFVKIMSGKQFYISKEILCLFFSTTTTPTEPSSAIEAARSCVLTGDCRKTERIPAEIFDGVPTRDEKVKKNRRVISKRTKQQLSTQDRLCLIAKIC